MLAPVVVGRFQWLLAYGDIQSVVGKPHKLLFPEDARAHLLWYMDRNSRKDHRLNMTISFNPLYYHENSCWANNRGHKDDLSLIEQNLLIVGSSFSVFTVLSSISEGRDEEGI